MLKLLIIIVELDVVPIPTGVDRLQLKSPFIRTCPSAKLANCSDLCTQSHGSFSESLSILHNNVRIGENYPDFQPVGCRYVTSLTGQMENRDKAKTEILQPELPLLGLLLGFL